MAILPPIFKTLLIAYCKKLETNHFFIFYKYLRIHHEFYLFLLEEIVPYRTINKCCLELYSKNLGKKIKEYC